MFLLIKLHAHSLIKDIMDRNTLILIILGYPIFRYYNLPTVHTSLICVFFLIILSRYCSFEIKIGYLY